MSKSVYSIEPPNKLKFGIRYNGHGFHTMDVELWLCNWCRFTVCLRCFLFLLLTRVCSCGWFPWLLLIHIVLILARKYGTISKLLLMILNFLTIHVRQLWFVLFTIWLVLPSTIDHWLWLDLGIFWVLSCIWSIGCKVRSIDSNLDDMFHCYFLSIGLSQKEAPKGSCRLLVKGNNMRMIKTTYS